jgi:hypothetical protein
MRDPRRGVAPGAEEESTAASGRLVAGKTCVLHLTHRANTRLIPGSVEPVAPSIPAQSQPRESAIGSLNVSFQAFVDRSGMFSCHLSTSRLTV